MDADGAQVDRRIRISCNKQAAGRVKSWKIRWCWGLMKKHLTQSGPFHSLCSSLFTATGPVHGWGHTQLQILKSYSNYRVQGHYLLAHHFGRFLGGSKRSLMLLLQCPIIEMHAVELVVSFFFSFSFLWRWLACSCTVNKPLYTWFLLCRQVWTSSMFGLITTKFWLNWLWIQGYVNSATFGGLVGVDLLFFAQIQ